MRWMTAALPAAAALAAAPAPAAAQDRALDVLDDPVRVEMMADAIEVMSEALLSMPVGPIAEAMRRANPDAAPHVRPGDTVADVTGSDPALPYRMGQEARALGDVAGATARQLAVALPVLAAMARDMAAQWSQRMEEARNRHR